jgi:hypothetical protein
MTGLREALAQATALLSTLARIDRSTLSNVDLVFLLESEQAAKRLLDSSQAFTSAEVSDRSRYELGAEGLSMTHGHRRPVDFIEHTTLVSKAEAARRVRIGSAVRPRKSLLGEALPAERPILANAMTDGLVGMESANIILFSLKQGERGSAATPENMDAAERSLVEFAVTNLTDDVADLGRGWRDALDPDGIEPRYEDILLRAGVRIGPERNGITRYTIDAAPPMAAVLDAALVDSMDPKVGPRFLSDEDRARAAVEIVERDGKQVERLIDPRSRQRKQYDILEGVFAAGLAATREGPADRRTIGTVTAVIPLKDLLSGEGFGILEGIDEIIPASVIQQLACETGFEPVVIGNEGQPLYHGTRVRYVTPVQRRSLIVRDGDRCVGPGCRKRAATAHGHHVIFASRGGPTDIDNAVLLCPAHHAALHQGAFEIKMVDAMPFVRFSVDAMDDGAWKPAGRNRLMLPAV